MFAGKSSMGIESEIEKAINTGHNIIITGQAGTGKSFTIKRLYRKLLNEGKRAKIVATTGIASTMYNDAATVHSFFGLQDGRFSTQQLIQRVCFDDNFHQIHNRILNTDVLFIDEVSMMSLVIFEQIEALCRAVRKETVLFGGMQIVLCGDFLQLKPVPNPEYEDPGEYVFKSSKFIFHRFILEDVHRQTEASLIKAVHELSRGEVSTETENFLTRMKRNLPPGNSPVKLFARNYDVEKYNADRLMELEGDVKVFKAVDTGEVEHLSRVQVQQSLYLKENAPIMLLVNLSSKLVNGLCGFVKSFCEENVKVFFPTIDQTVTISPYSFSVFSREKGINVACRKQIPLKLAFAITTHKSQGLTLDRVEIDCRHMTNPGQIGVAVGRASEVKGLRVLNFSRKLVRKHHSDVFQFYTGISTPFDETGSLSCCRGIPESTLQCDNKSQTEPYDKAIEMKKTIEINEENETVVSDEDMESLIDIDVINVIDQLYSEWEEEGEVEKVDFPLPTDVKLQDILNELRYNEVITKEQMELNMCITDLENHHTRLSDFANHIYNYLYSFFEQSIPKDSPIENRHTTLFFKKITLFIGDTKYQNLVKSLFQFPEPSRTHYRLAFGILQKLRGIIISKAAEPVYQEAREKAQKKSASIKDSAGSKAKIRYIGGWCVATLRYRKKLFVKRNLYKKSMKQQVDKCDKEVRFLDQLTETEEAACEVAKEKSSLIEISRKQNVASGLTVIGDKAFDFFLELDKNIQKLESNENLNLHGKSFYMFIYSELENNKTLDDKWNSLFSDEDGLRKDDFVETLQNLLQELITKYLKMSSGQFRKDYKRDLKIQKEEAHRKQIRIREGKRSKLKQKFDFDTILEDDSSSKLKSHLRLNSEIIGNEAYLEVYTKDKLLRLCAGYDVKTTKALTKKDIINLLNSAVLKSSGMPHPEKLELISASVPNTEKPTKLPTVRKGRKRKHVTVGKGKKKQKTQTKPLDFDEPTCSESSTAQTCEESCGICKRMCADSCVCCDLCDTWYHFDCLRVTGEEEEFQDDWFCNVCKN